MYAFWHNVRVQHLMTNYLCYSLLCTVAIMNALNSFNFYLEKLSVDDAVESHSRVDAMSSNHVYATYSWRWFWTGILSDLQLALICLNLHVLFYFAAVLVVKNLTENSPREGSLYETC